MPEDSHRLPRYAIPRRYELVLEPDLPAAAFAGRVTVDLDLHATTASLLLNAHELEIDGAELTTPDGTVVAGHPSLLPEQQRLRLDFERDLPEGDGYQLTIAYRGILNDQLRGFYRSTFRDADGTERTIATTQFESTDARRAFPCWDEPDFKATFAVTLVVGEGLTGLSNGPLEESTPLADGRTRLRFGETMRMSTYVVAFLVGPFEVTEAEMASGVPVRIAAVPGKLGLSRFALDVAKHSITFLTDYFGIPYPASKIDHIAVPDFAFGAMENLGCVTYRESLLLVDPPNAAQTELQRVASVVAHETSHMWFGDLVTMKWWNGIWLNEAFATFMEVTTANAYRPEWQMWTAFGSGRAAAMSIDGLRATRPVEFPVGAPEEAEGMFDVLTYQKGGSVLRMLEQYLGPEVFRKGISHYLSTHAYGNTETADLWDAIENVSGEPVRQIMDTWINQGGYPVIEVTSSSDPATVGLRQRRFLYDGTADEQGRRWAVPVNLRASVGGQVHRERILLDGEEGSVTFPGPVEWAVVNDGASGFYRTRYSSDLWQRLEAAGPLSVLDPLERLQLLSDAWASVVAGGAALREWATIALAVATEPDPDVWGAVASVLNQLHLIAGEAEREALAAFVEQLARPAWEALGWDAPEGEDQRRATARSIVLQQLALLGGDTQLQEEASQRLTKHLQGEGRKLPADLVGAAARVHVASGGTEAWETVQQAFLDAEGPQEKLRWLYSLAEAPNSDLRERTLAMVISPDVRSQDAPFLLMGVLSRPGQRQGWDWFESRWSDVSAYFPTSLLVRAIEPVVSFVDSDLAARVHSFVDTHDTGLAPVRLQQLLERMDVTVALAGRLKGHLAEELAPAS